MLSKLIMLVISEQEVRALADIDELIEALEKAHIQYSTHSAVMPARLVVPLPAIQGHITSMPGFLSDDKALGMKVVTYFQQNPKLDLPAILATIMLFSADTGKIIAIMDGSYITAIRTACASAMATKALANPQTPVLGILGAGVQARAHIQALSRVRKIESIRLYSPSGTSAAAIKKDMAPQLNCVIEVAHNAETVVRDADLLVTVTTAKEPILKSEWLKPGVHINAVGSHRPDLREIDGDLRQAHQAIRQGIRVHLRQIPEPSQQPRAPGAADHRQSQRAVERRHGHSERKTPVTLPRICTLRA